MNVVSLQIDRLCVTQKLGIFRFDIVASLPVKLGIAALGINSFDLQGTSNLFRLGIRVNVDVAVISLRQLQYRRKSDISHKAKFLDCRIFVNGQELVENAGCWSFAT